MSEPVQIGIREVYDAVTGLAAEVRADRGATEVRLARHDERIGALERAAEGSKAHHLKMWITLLAAGLATPMSIVSLFVR